MPALAISDHGNMFGAFEFVKEAYSDYNKNADGTLKTSKFLLAMVIALILGVISTAFLWSF